MGDSIRLALLLLVVACAIRYVENCTCFPSHPQQQFCRADFALRGRIIRVKNIPFPGNTRIKDRIYYVKVLENFKKKSKLPAIVKIVSAASSATCGLYIDLKKHPRVWLFTGTISDKKIFRVNSCGWNAPFKTLTPYQKNSLRKCRYEHACTCAKEIIYCSQGKCTTKHACKWPSGHVSSCLAKYAYCKPCKKSGHCRWQHGYGFNRRCMKPKKG